MLKTYFITKFFPTTNWNYSIDIWEEADSFLLYT